MSLTFEQIMAGETEETQAKTTGLTFEEITGKPAPDPMQDRVDAAAVAAVPEQAAPAPAEDAGWLEKVGAMFANAPAPGPRGDVAAMAAVTTPEMEEFDQAKTDQMYNIQIGELSQADSDKLEEASHTAGYAKEGGAWAEIGGDMGAGAARAFLYDEDYAAILSSRNPGSQLIRDPEGNLIIKYQDGNMERINKEGFSATDALQIPGEIAAYTGAGALYRRGAKSAAKPIIQEVTKRTLLKNAAKESGKAGAFSATKDLVGSGEVDLGRTLMEMGTAGIIQPAIDVGGGYLSRTGQKSAQQTKVSGQVQDSAGELAIGVREGMEKAGYDMGQRFDPEQIAKMNDYYMANPDLPPKELGIGAYAVATGQVPTNALISQDPNLKLRESNTIKKGDTYKPTLGQGPDAPASYGEHIVDPRGARTEQMIDDLNRPDDLGDVQVEMQSQKDAGYDEAAAKFKESRAEGFAEGELVNTKIQNTKIQDANTTIQKAVREAKGGTEIGTVPLIPIGGQYADGVPWRVSMGDIVAYRDTLRGVLRNDPAKAREAIQALQDAVDTNLDDAIWERGPGLFSIGQGGSDFVTKWREGIDELGTHFKKWDSQKFIKRALEQLPDGTGFKHDGKQIADNLFGGIEGKFLGKSEARKAVQDLQAQLPDDLWKQVQSELQYRMMGLHKYDSNIGTITGARTNAKRFNTFVEENPDLAETIFGGPEELAARKNYIKQLDLEYADPKLGAANTSNTSLGTGDKFDEKIAGLKERGGTLRAAGNVADIWRNPTGRAQRQTRDMLLDNTMRAKEYTGKAPQIGGLLSLLGDEDSDFQIPFRN